MSSEARKAQHRAFNAKRMQDPAYRAAQKARYRAWAAANKDDGNRKARKASQMRAYAKDPELRVKQEARWLLNRAVRAGRIIKGPCENCGSTEVQGHHDDYSNPLEVRWLCRKHHNDVHGTTYKPSTGAA